MLGYLNGPEMVAIAMGLVSVFTFFLLRCEQLENAIRHHAQTTEDQYEADATLYSTIGMKI